ncbi:MAG: GatB/YqeY domain-containing protein, partial [Patescibacteria group bacterium]
MLKSSIYQKLESDLLSALKRKEAFVVKVLRFLKSNLDSAEKDKLAPLTDEEAMKVIQKRIKQSQDAKEKYILGKRDELAAAEQSEIDLIAAYLPAQLSEVELADLAKSAIAELNASSVKDFGRVM